MTTTDGKNACLRMSFCGMPLETQWKVKLFNLSDDEYTDSPDYPFYWIPDTVLNDVVTGHMTFTPNSSDVISKAVLSNDDFHYAEFDLSEILVSGKTLTLILPVGWQ